MSPAIFLYMQTILQSIPAILAAGGNVALLVAQASAALHLMLSEKREPSPAEWDALNAITASLRGQLHAKT